MQKSLNLKQQKRFSSLAYHIDIYQLFLTVVSHEFHFSSASFSLLQLW